MGSLLKLFTGNPVMMVWVALALFAAGVASGGSAAWTLNGWRLGIKVEQAERQRDAAVAQGKVLAEGVKACSASVDLAHEAATQAVDQGKAMLAEARRLTTGGQNQVKRIEELLAKGAPPDAGCEQAWKDIEAIRKAGAAP